jgi:hypothetical protein
MARIRKIKKGLTKEPQVPGPPAFKAQDPSRGKSGAIHPLRIKPIETRVYGKKVAPVDPGVFERFGEDVGGGF